MYLHPLPGLTNIVQHAVSLMQGLLKAISMQVISHAIVHVHVNGGGGAVSDVTNGSSLSTHLTGKNNLRVDKYLPPRE